MKRLIHRAVKQFYYYNTAGNFKVRTEILRLLLLTIMLSFLRGKEREHVAGPDRDPKQELEIYLAIGTYLETATSFSPYHCSILHWLTL